MTTERIPSSRFGRLDGPEPTPELTFFQAEDGDLVIVETNGPDDAWLKLDPAFAVEGAE